MNIKPIADWQDPKTSPITELYSENEFWVAVKSTREDRNGNKTEHSSVFCAQYVNRPLILDENGDPENDDYFNGEDGEALNSIGWYTVERHCDFDNFYEPLQFSDNYILLGWAEYLKPDFS